MNLGEQPSEKYKTWFYEEVGRRIKAHRKNIKETQEALADALQLSRVSINNIESGKQRLPMHILNDVAYLLNIPVGELIPLRSEYDSLITNP